MGQRAADTVAITFEDVVVPKEVRHLKQTTVSLFSLNFSLKPPVHVCCLYC